MLIVTKPGSSKLTEQPTMQFRRNNFTTINLAHNFHFYSQKFTWFPLRQWMLRIRRAGWFAPSPDSWRKPFFKRLRTILELFSAFLSFPNYFAFVPASNGGPTEVSKRLLLLCDSIRWEWDFSTRSYSSHFHWKVFRIRWKVGNPEDWKWSFDIPSIFHPSKLYGLKSSHSPQFGKIYKFWRYFYLRG